MIEFLKKLSINKLLFLATSTLVVLSVMVYFIVSISRPSFGIIYSNLSEQDRNTVALKLQSMGINYQIVKKNSQILVPVDKVLSLRMFFAQEGVINSGNIIGYEIFDKETGLGNSQFLNNINVVRALEGELSRTINNLAYIKDSRVHLVLPKKELFSKTDTKPSASIMLKTKNGATILRKEVKAIANLVAKAVPELSVDNITIIDSVGNLLKTPDQEFDNMLSEGGFNSIEYQGLIESKLKVMIENLLESRVGVGKVRVSVNAKINPTKEVMFSEIFDPEGRVVRSKKTSEESENDESDADNVSVANNIPNTEQGYGDNTNRDLKKRRKSNDITNYEISKTVINKVIERGGVEKLSVAVMLDGTYTYDERTKKHQYHERTESEINKLKILIQSAIGYDEKRGDRVEIINLEFTTDNAFNDASQKLNWFDVNGKNLIQIGMAGFIVILLILLILRPLLIGLLEKNKNAMSSINKFFNFNKLKLDDELPEKLNISNEATENNISASQQAEKKIEKNLLHGDARYNNVIDSVNNLVEQYPEKASDIIKEWLHNSNTVQKHGGVINE